MLTPAANGVKSSFQSEDTASCFLLECAPKQRAGKWKASYSKGCTRALPGPAGERQDGAHPGAGASGRSQPLALLAAGVAFAIVELTGSDGNASPAAGGRATEPESALQPPEPPAAEPPGRGASRCDRLDRRRRRHRDGHGRDSRPTAARTFFDARRPGAQGRRRAREPRGDALDGRDLEVRRRQSELLRLPDAPVVRQVAQAAGFTVLNLANNHAFDYGADRARSRRSGR